MRRTTTCWMLCLGWLLTLASVHAAENRSTRFAKAAYDVKIVEDVDYFGKEKSDPIKHKLDLYLPKNHQDFPVLFFVHGGAWRSGDKSYLGVYSNLGKFYASRGIGTVVINYRLSPKIQHPEHVKDVARAFAWTVRNISRHGGRPDAIFACGHSAGGHLVSLLATDAAYLTAEGLKTSAVRGVVPISGIYRIPERFLANVFGSDPKLRRLAGPIEHVRRELPPFLILCAEKDYPMCGKLPSEEFCKALRDKGVTASVQEFKENSHLSIIVNVARAGNPVAEAVLEFIDQMTQKN